MLKWLTEDDLVLIQTHVLPEFQHRWKLVLNRIRMQNQREAFVSRNPNCGIRVCVYCGHQGENVLREMGWIHPWCIASYNTVKHRTKIG